LLKVEAQEPGDQKNELSFVSDVTFKDGTLVSPGQPVNKVWRVRNTGTAQWKSGYSLVFFGGEQMGGPGELPLPEANPGDTRDISLALVAPAEIGVHRSAWKPRNPQGIFSSMNCICRSRFRRLFSLAIWWMMPGSRRISRSPTIQ